MPSLPDTRPKGGSIIVAIIRRVKKCSACREFESENVGARANGYHLERQGKIATEDGRRSYLDGRRRVH